MLVNSNIPPADHMAVILCIEAVLKAKGAPTLYWAGGQWMCVHLFFFFYLVLVTSHSVFNYIVSSTFKTPWQTSQQIGALLVVSIMDCISKMGVASRSKKVCEEVH